MINNTELVISKNTELVKSTININRLTSLITIQVFKAPSEVAECGSDTRDIDHYVLTGG